MKTVQGAMLKAAAHEHARKQLSAIAGINRKCSTVTFTGNTAYAYWDADYAGEVSSWAINYPALPDNALVSRRDADLISAYTLHECGHIAYTATDVTKLAKSQLLFAVWNAVEDARIEHAVIASGKAHGARSGFRKLVSKFTAWLPGDFNPTSINWAPMALALVCRAAYGDGNAFCRTLLQRIPEPKRSVFARIAAAMPSLRLDREGTMQTLTLAEQFLREWGDLQAGGQQAQEGRQQAGYSQEGEDYSDDQQSPQDASDEAEDSDSEESAGVESGEGDEWGEEDGGSPKDGQLSDWIEQDRERDTLRDAMNSTAVEQERDSSPMELSGDDGEDGGSIEGGIGDDLPPFDDSDEAFDAAQLADPDPNIDDIFEGARRRTAAPIDLTPIGDIKWSDMRKWPSVPEKTEEQLARSAKNMSKKNNLPALKAGLVRILRAPERCGWDAGALGGRFDGKRASRLMAGSESVFRRRWMSEGIDTAVSVLIDLSGSMGGSRINEAVDLAWQIADGCERSGAMSEVLAFTTEYGGGSAYAHGRTLRGEHQHSMNGQQGATVVIAKRFSDKLTAVVSHFQRLKRAAAGATPDYAATRAVVERLSTAPAARKLCVVITDGFGRMAEQKRLTTVAHQLYGVDVIGFGIGTSNEMLSQAYAVGGAVDEAEQLHRVVLQQVSRQLSQRDTRRVQ